MCWLVHAPASAGARATGAVVGCVVEGCGPVVAGIVPFVAWHALEAPATATIVAVIHGKVVIEGARIADSPPPRTKGRDTTDDIVRIAPRTALSAIDLEEGLLAAFAVRLGGRYSDIRTND